MKLNNIALAAFSALALSACSDYLEVDAPSKTNVSEAYSTANDVNTALNGVYANLLSSNTYGEKLLSIYTLNSDVDFYPYNGHYSTTNSYRRFDCDPDGGEIYNAWSQFYGAIEAANIFVDQLENSELIKDENEFKTYRQKLGEAKVIRAINYHDLIWMFGDVPMSLEPSYNVESLVYPVTDRKDIIDALIADLEEVAPDMTSAVNLDCDHISQEMAWAMIARLSLTAAGYTLRPEGSSYGKMELMNPGNADKYYRICRDYCQKVIESGSYDLTKYDFYKVFVNECNGILGNGGDVIFEIPFGNESTGSIGYMQGPKMSASDGETPHVYGATSPSASLNAFYRFFFDEDDIRRDYINQLLYYPSTGEAAFIQGDTKGRTVYNGKWSKLWVNGGLGKNTTGSTGINFPYMRYTDVLLMFAEAENEINNGPTEAAMSALEVVRTRAFAQTNPAKITAYAKGSVDEFRTAVLDERKFEFAGENMRWRDLVRHNLLAENTFWNFYRYFSVAEDYSTGSSDAIEAVGMHDFGDEDYYSNKFPQTVYYLNDQTISTAKSNDCNRYEECYFPNQNVKVVTFYGNSESKKVTAAEATAFGNVSKISLMDDWGSDSGLPNEYMCYSFRGYIYCDYERTGTVYINNNGTYTSAPDPRTLNPETLPVVRYILPYPRNVINRSNGQYSNSYGY